MSKASEYARKVEETKSLRPAFKATPVSEDTNKVLDFTVSPKGDLEINSYIHLSPEEALRLADWIKETFSY